MTDVALGFVTCAALVMLWKVTYWWVTHNSERRKESAQNHRRRIAARFIENDHERRGQ